MYIIPKSKELRDVVNKVVTLGILRDRNTYAVIGMTIALKYPTTGNEVTDSSKIHGYVDTLADMVPLPGVADILEVAVETSIWRRAIADGSMKPITDVLGLATYVQKRHIEAAEEVDLRHVKLISQLIEEMIEEYN